MHLHVHSEYSLLDGACRIKELPKRAAALGQSALAITDHGAMYGVVDFYNECRQSGIKPIIGCEVYTAARKMSDKSSGLDSASGHLILLAKNQKGYQNLVSIVSAGFLHGFYYKPRIDFEVLEKYSEGIIALSACLAGDVARALLRGDYEGAAAIAARYAAIFGKENYFLELQDHGMREQRQINPQIVRLSKETGIGLVATNDVHYLTRDEADFQDVLMCIQTAATVSDENRMRFETNEFYLKSADEMKRLFEYAPEAISNTKKIADMCNVEFEFNTPHLPGFGIVDPEEAFSYLSALCHEGAGKRYGKLTPELSDRLTFELETIKSMGYVDYFLIVWDFIKYARNKKIMVGPGRGSAAGSLVSYCLGITNVDPMRYNLLFERFLNPERISMPDIDIDFCYERRQEVIDYVIEKYGADRVAQIITFGTMAARAAVRDTGRALGMPYGEVDIIAKLIPAELGMTIERALSAEPRLMQMYGADSGVKRLIDTAKALEGLPRHASTHAAGVVISKEPLIRYVPLQKNDDVVTTQFPMGIIEKLGLLKMDFLGLRNLTVIRDCISLAQKDGLRIDIDDISYEEKGVYEMISRAETDGVFQLESSGMKQFMKELCPTTLEDIIAGVSLYRPGPMDQIPLYIRNKNNPKNIRYKHPLLKKILEMTYGCIVYQEQVMQIVREVGGYSMGRADLVRRAMSKKNIEVMKEERANFIFGNSEGGGGVVGAAGNGVDKRVASEIFDEMMDFAKYAFNKSHAAAYAVVAYQTAYLKHFFPVHYMAALLTSVLGTSDKINIYIADCARMGIRLLPPDINKSGYSFSVDFGAIRFGLGAIKNVGRKFVEECIKEREAAGPFKSLGDLAKRMSQKDINKRAVEGLIKSGALDFAGLHRSQLMDSYERILEAEQAEQRRNLKGQLSFFEAEAEGAKDDYYPDIAEFEPKKLLSMEKEAIGLYLSAHPLDSYRRAIEAFSNISAAQLGDEQIVKRDRSFVKISGIVAHRKNKITKNNAAMAFITLEDLTASAEIIVFPKILTEFDSLLAVDSIITVGGRIDAREDGAAKIIAETVCALEPCGGEVSITVPKGLERRIDELGAAAKKYPGASALSIILKDGGRKIPCAAERSVNLCPEFINEAKAIFGDDCIKTAEQ